MSISQIISHFNIPIKEIIIADNLISKANHLVDRLGFNNKKILLVTDQNIYPQIAKIISDSLNLKSEQVLILQQPKAEYKTALEISHKAQNCDLIIAVGSGTINDLCKLASFKNKIPYIIFGTAPSMNGYASANVSITINSHKTSIPAHLATAIYLDLDILSTAPERLIKSGIGDSLCVSTCQFDWLLSHFLLETTYNQNPFDLLKNHHLQLLDYQGKITDKNLIKLLAETLILSGLGMYICRGSYPASQAEHLVAHYLEIKYPEISNNFYHGEQIAICTLSIADIQEQILSHKNLQITSNNFDEKYLEQIFGKELGKHFFTEIIHKSINQEKADKINNNLQKNWEDFREILEKLFISKNRLLSCYKQFSLVEKCEEIGFNQTIYNEAINNAALIRNRFTSLDLIKLIKK